MRSALRAIAVASLLGLSIYLAGCAEPSAKYEPPPYPSFDTTSPESPDDADGMPDLSGLTLARVWSRHGPGFPGDIWVTFPSETLTVTVAADYIAGAAVPERVTSYAIPQRRLHLDKAATEHYIVATQSVAPGESITPGMSVELTASPGWDETEPWPFAGHVNEVVTNGAIQCFECHDESACADCHIAMDLGSRD